MKSLDLLQLEQSRWHLGMIAVFAPLSHPCSTRTPVPPNAQIDSPPLTSSSSSVSPRQLLSYWNGTIKNVTDGT
jgi:hypothetical protein